jgi:hypothetical protein
MLEWVGYRATEDGSIVVERNSLEFNRRMDQWFIAQGGSRQRPMQWMQGGWSSYMARERNGEPKWETTGSNPRLPSLLDWLVMRR